MIETYEEAIECVIRNPYNFNEIPRKFLTRKLCMMALSVNNLMHIPDEFINYDIYKHALRNVGLALENVPKDKRVKELCEIAVKQDIGALGYVPDHLLTKEMINIALNSPSYIWLKKVR